ncbi:hypothetical protein C0Q70_00973 [Pomacea canaliculata]|uniref:Cyclin-F n=2 Tax=Pomacea canaliculata TaxID=400727 RepID=A0A2T7PY76_POMCA|nr:cyclin-F-like isoform X3 [Pomacea canaliculata]PVD38359.1 hypothetical protein C0Q70_00973 [Pomacea canaliculata]
MRPRTRSSVTIWHLPDELLVHILKGMHIRDLLTLKQTHPRFQQIVDSNQYLWTFASFFDSWPSLANLAHYNSAAKHGNLEALIKLGVAYLYNEGLSSTLEEDKDIAVSGRLAAEYFCKVEEISGSIAPFTWLFIRPPWSASGACCKACVFETMKTHADKNPSRDIAVCVAQTLSLLGQENEACGYLEKAIERGSDKAMFLQWLRKHPTSEFEKAKEVEAIRQLRSIANAGNLEARMILCHCYSLRQFGGIAQTQAFSFSQEVFQSSSPLGFLHIFSGIRDLTPSMRYILVDWLVEVACMKNFSTLTLHNAVSIVDHFLAVRDVPRSKLQLLGVSAMVISSRYLGTDIVTIREAAWLTDNTYKYEDVVRMMGEIIATLGGKVRFPTSSDFVRVLAPLAQLEERGVCLIEYVCELSILQAEMAQYSPAEIAASCVLLSRLLLKAGCPWTSVLEEFTGFSSEDLSRCTFHMHEKCFLEGSVVDHRSVTLRAVKQRYSDDRFHRVAEIEIISYEELCTMLGVTDHILQGADIKLKFRNTDELIVSPSRGRSRRYRRTVQALKREEASTPPLELSGYEGDHEDESGVSFDHSDSCSIKSEDVDSEVRMDADTDTPLMCLSASCLGGPHPGAGGIHISFTSPPIVPASNCSCSVSSFSSGVCSLNSPSSSSPERRVKYFRSSTCDKSSVNFFLEDSSPSEEDSGAGVVNEEIKIGRKTPRTPTKMTSPNALRRKSRKRNLSQSIS